MRYRTPIVSFVLALLTVGAALAQPLSAPMEYYDGAGEFRVEIEPVLGAAALDNMVSPSLAAATVAATDQLEQLVNHNASGTLPVRNGFFRALPEPIVMGPSEGADTYSGQLSATPWGHPVWGTSVHVDDSYRLRLRLDDVNLPADTFFVIYSASGERITFGLELLDSEGGMWTPSVSGPTAYLEALLRGNTFDPREHGFRIGKIGELVELGPRGLPMGMQNAAEPLGECLIDATCIGPGMLPVIDAYRTAVAHLAFAVPGGFAICTGGLVNDTVGGSFIPYLLTANHCFNSPNGANSLEAFWDYKTSNCGGNFPNLGNLPRSSGSTLLVTSPTTDFTLVRLNNVPGARFFLGWIADPNAVAHGTVLHRVSHPAPGPGAFPQSYTRSVVATSGTPIAGVLERPFYLYHRLDSGGIFPGSSGSPVILANGQIVGQLYGVAGPAIKDGCDARNSQVDGAFTWTFPMVQPWLAPGTTDTSPCFASQTTACLLNNRFEVEVFWNTNSGAGPAKVMNFGNTRAQNDQSVFWWFFNAANFEMGVKMADACIPALGNRYWVFVSGLTNQGYLVTVRDTHTGRIKFYSNPLTFLPTTAGDTFAFPCN